MYNKMRRIEASQHRVGADVTGSCNITNKRIHRKCIVDVRASYDSENAFFLIRGANIDSKTSLLPWKPTILNTKSISFATVLMTVTD